ncbi:hypothetical protein Tco_1318810 [Tanacetum coccineum]
MKFLSTRPFMSNRCMNSLRKELNRNCLENLVTCSTMMKGSDIVFKRKRINCLIEMEMFTSTNGESIESYYHCFSKLMNDFKRNKHFPEKIASNLKFLKNLQPEWSRHVTIVHQTKDLHTTDYTQLYDFLIYIQKEVDDLRAERLAKTHDPLALMANSNNPFNYLVLSSRSTNIKYPTASTTTQLTTINPKPSFNKLQPIINGMPNPKDSNYRFPTTAMNMHFSNLNAFKLNYSTPTNNNQKISSNPRNRQIAQPGMNLGQDRHMQMVGGNGENQFRQYTGQNVGNQNGYNAVQNVKNQASELRGEGITAVSQTQLLIAQKKKQEVNVKLHLMANFAAATTLVLQTDKDFPSMIQTDQLSSAKTITTLNEEIANLNNMLSKEKSNVSSLLEEKKKLKSDFKICEDELLDKQIQLENKKTELDNILRQNGSIDSTMHMLHLTKDSFYHTEQKMAFGYQNPFYLKQAQQK